MLGLHFKVGIMCWCQSINNKCCDLAGPCGSYYDWMIPSAIKSVNFREEKEQDFIKTPGGYRAQVELHSKVTGSLC